jgi:Putative rhamnosyl transferase
VRVFGYMRFSYAGQSDARTSRTGQPIEEIASILYDPRRMERRFFLFENLCLPSIAWQKNQDFRLVILASKIMPDIYKERLAEVTAEVPQIEILYSNEPHVTDALNPRIAELVAGIDGPTAHFRLDDDDALGWSYTARLEAALALSPLVSAVTYPTGLYLSYQEGVPHLLPEHQPCIGIGLAFLNPPGTIRNPYQCQHLKLPQSTPVFSDPVPLAYIHTAHASSDTRGRQARKFRNMLALAKSETTMEDLRRIRAGLRQEFPGITVRSLKDLIRLADRF